MSIVAEAAESLAARDATKASQPMSSRAAPRSAVALREIVLSLFLLFWYGFFFQVPVWNENSRYDLVRALVDDHTTIIDRYHTNTGDKAFYDGHYYSTKPPGSALLGAPAYAAMRLAAVLTGSDRPGSR